MDFVYLFSLRFAYSFDLDFVYLLSLDFFVYIYFVCAMVLVMSFVALLKIYFGWVGFGFVAPRERILFLNDEDRSYSFTYFSHLYNSHCNIPVIFSCF